MDGKTVICLDEGIMAIGAEWEEGAVAILRHRRIPPVWLPDINMVTHVWMVCLHLADSAFEEV